MWAPKLEHAEENKRYFKPIGTNGGIVISTGGVYRRTCPEPKCLTLTNSCNNYFCAPHAMLHGILPPAPIGCSRVACEFFDAYCALPNTEKIDWRYRISVSGQSGNEKEGLLEEHPKWKPDGFDSETNTVFEFYGDWYVFFFAFPFMLFNNLFHCRYHGYPPWHENYLSSVVGEKWGPELFSESWDRLGIFHEAGYTVKYIFQSDYDRTKGKNRDKNLLDVVYTYPNRPKDVQQWDDISTL